jgi:hypothetical protein
VAAAFAAGLLSYCKVRAITRVEDANLRLLDAESARAPGGSRDPSTVARRRADALMALVRAGADGAGTAGSDRYMLHLIADVDALTGRFGGRAELADVRDNGRCRFAGCHRRTADIHHIRHFEDGGPTAVDNGATLCPRHHTAVHERGFRSTGDPNSALTFHRPDGTVLGSTRAGPFFWNAAVR